MTDVETRLRDALAARGAAVAPGPHTYARVVGRRTRRRRVRQLAVAGAVALAGSSAALTTSTAPPPPATRIPVAPAPTTFMAVVDAEATLYFDVDSPMTAFSSATPVDHAATAVAAFGDSRRYVVAARGDRCVSVLHHYDIHTNTPEKRETSTSTVRGPDVRGEVDGMAVSPDGTRLAYTVRPRAGADCGHGLDLRVRDLSTGRERVWRGPAVVASVEAGESVSWSPDGRHVLVGVAFLPVDTAARGTTLRTDPAAGVLYRGGNGCHVTDRTYRGLTGAVVAFAYCPDDDVVGAWLVEDGALADPLFAVDDDLVLGAPLTFDRSGDHALVPLLDDDGSGQVTVYRWDGVALRPLPLAGEVSSPAW